MCSRRRVRVSVSRVEKNFKRRCEIEIRARKILAGWDHVSNGFERARLFVDYLGLGKRIVHFTLQSVLARSFRFIVLTDCIRAVDDVGDRSR